MALSEKIELTVRISRQAFNRVNEDAHDATGGNIDARDVIIDKLTEVFGDNTVEIIPWQDAGD